MSAIRVKRKSTPYVILDTTALNDPRLSFRAKGLHAYLLAKPDDWRVYIAQLASEGTDRTHAVREAIHELEAAGYVRRCLARDGQGRLHGWETTVYETPELAASDLETSEQPTCENPPSDIAVSENRTLLNIESTQVLNLEETPLASLGEFTRECTRETGKLSAKNGQAPKAVKPTPSRRAPSNFAITPSLLAWGREHTPGVNLAGETDKFLDHEFATPRRDWAAAWRNWMRKAAEMGTARLSPGSSSSPALDTRLSAKGQRSLLAAQRILEEDGNGDVFAGEAQIFARTDRHG